MTRDEFIDGYMERSGISAARRLPDGFTVPTTNHPGRIALPCACGDEGCSGWAMIRRDPECIAEYAEVYGPGGWAVF